MEKEKKMEEEKITGFKGFDRDLKCRGFQYEVGKSYEEKVARACLTGFHLCINPLDVLRYYSPAQSRFAEVEGSGKLDKRADDSKVAAPKISVKAEIGLKGLLDSAFKFIFEKIEWTKEDTPQTHGYSSAAQTHGASSAAQTHGDYSAAQTHGYYSAAQTHGDSSAAQTHGYYSAAQTHGYYSAAQTHGDYSAAQTHGEDSIAVSTGIAGKAAGIKGNWLTLAEWKKKEGFWHLCRVKAVRVDGKKIKANVFYQLQNGKFVESK